MSETVVYFIQEIGGGPIKIGYCKDLWQRLANLQLGNWRKLRILGSLDGGRIEEQRIHNRFKRVSGEWFEATVELLAFISESTRTEEDRRKPSRDLSQKVSDWLEKRNNASEEKS